MIFCGPTGVGKTELTKAVASLYYGAEKAMVRLDMSEYMSAFSVSRLTGPPPGYVGYEEGGQLTDAVRRTPHTVVLFDEVEKAHPDVFNVLLQVLDDGRLTDNKGRTVDFSNAMIVLTSNVGSRRILELAGRQGQDREAAYRQMRAAVKQELGSAFRPEFLNRLDEVIVFESLQQSEVEQVAELMLADLRERCEEEGFGLNWTPKVKEFVARNGASSKFGARPLRRAVQRYCEDAIAQAFLEGFIQPEDGDFIELDVSQSGNILLRNSRGQNKDFVPQSAQGIEDDEDGGDGFVDASGATTIDGLTGRVVNDFDADRPLSLGR
jgi:ATP-dependent Clp protease ATP-binding subunit ClpC